MIWPLMLETMSVLMYWVPKMEYTPRPLTVSFHDLSLSLTFENSTEFQFAKLRTCLKNQTGHCFSTHEELLDGNLQNQKLSFDMEVPLQYYLTTWLLNVTYFFAKDEEEFISWELEPNLSCKDNDYDYVIHNKTSAMHLSGFVHLFCPRPRE